MVLTRLSRRGGYNDKYDGGSYYDDGDDKDNGDSNNNDKDNTIINSPLNLLVWKTY